MSIQDYVVPLERARELERIVQAYTVPCDKCEGRGHMSGPTTQGPCISCGTSGVIHPYATGLGAWLASRPCRKCRGFAIAYTTPGGDMVNEVCDACHGTGKQSEWPSLVWYRFPEPEYAEAFPKRADWQFDMWESVGHAFMEWRQFSFEAEYVHALTFDAAFALLEECAGWRDEKHWIFGKKVYQAYHPDWPDKGGLMSGKPLEADSQAELLDAMLVKETPDAIR